MGLEYEPLGSFQKSAGFYLDAADDALRQGQTRLAIHLYYAAFEVAHGTDAQPSLRAIDGMRTAWRLALEQGDRSTAEAIFGDLMPYNTPEQTQDGIERLQALAVNQLEEIGLTRDGLEDMANSISQGTGEDQGNVLADSLRAVLETIGRDLGLQDEAIEDVSPTKGTTDNRQNGVIIKRSQPQKITSAGTPGTPHHATAAPHISYRELTGYEDSLRKMRDFGFVAAGDASFAEFVKQTSAFHGVEGIALMDTLGFYGPSREDTAFFAMATAGEIGFPVLSMVVDLDESGNGSIKISGPIKRSFFGPPEFTELPSPCTLVIQNIDYLQMMFNNEREARHNGYQMAPHGRSMQAEVMAHLHALLHRSEVYVITTTATEDSLGGQLNSLLAPIQWIEINGPTRDERYDVLKWFALGHPSCAGLDFGRLAELSDGISRFDLVSAGHQAVEEAYRESLHSNRRRPVSMGDMLVQFSTLVDHETEQYMRIEDAVVQQFTSTLE
jgi:hypothetical protein